MFRLREKINLLDLKRKEKFYIKVDKSYSKKKSSIYHITFIIELFYFLMSL